MYKALFGEISPEGLVVLFWGGSAALAISGLWGSVCCFAALSHRGFQETKLEVDPCLHLIGGSEACVSLLAGLVEEVYTRTPEVIHQSALPVLWSMLGNKALPVRGANVRGVISRLASTLYNVMGTKLNKCAASQPQHVQEKLSNILGW